MSRPPKPNTPFSCRMDTEVFHCLEELCNESGMSKTVAVERAVMDYVNKYHEQQRLLQKAKAEK